MKLSIDLETFSEADLKLCGARRYSEHPTTEMLCMAYSVDGAEPRIWIPGQVFPNGLFDLASEIWAWNASFECAIFEGQGIVIPRDRWRCSMSLALSYGFPGDLDRASAAIGAPRKDSVGSALMRKLCKPRKPTKADPSPRYTRALHPAEFAALDEYCLQDVRAEMGVVARLPAQHLPEIEQRLYLIDLNANAHGVAVDLTSAVTIRARALDYGRTLAAEASELTSGLKTSQLARTREWLIERGVVLPNMQSQTIADALNEPCTDMPDDARRVLEIRSTLGQSSIAKYNAMIASACDDGRCKGLIQYMGAGRTGRWAGRLIQIQNLIRGCLGDFGPVLTEMANAHDPETLELFYDDVMTVYSSMLRSCIVASLGNVIVAADYSGIEARIVAWVAGEEWLLDLFRSGGDPYCMMASDVYGRPITKADDLERFMGKKLVLGAGFGLGSGTFLASCAKDGVTVTPEFAKEAIDAYRAKNQMIVKAWYGLEGAAKRAIRQSGVVHAFNGIRFKSTPRWLQLRLPSGRCLSYFKPRLDHDGALRYMGVSQTTGDWSEQYGYGGKFMQNVAEGISRDIMRGAIFRMEGTPYRYLFSVHDQVVAEVPEAYGLAHNDPTDMKRGGGEFNAILTVSDPETATLPIKAEGFIGRRYQK